MSVICIYYLYLSNVVFSLLCNVEFTCLIVMYETLYDVESFKHYHACCLYACCFV